jgi:undecaprenyl-diphosphatase
MLGNLTRFDKELFVLINRHYNDFFDVLMYWASDRLIWIPFYIALALILLKTYNKQFFFMIFFVGILIVISDQLSVVIKDFVQRPRPCHDYELESMVHLVRDHCGGAFGFISSHAANVFALTTFLFLACNDRLPWLKFIMLPWALLISYSRIYLGSHFPLDILGGWFLGIFLGIIIFYFYVLVAQSRRGPLKFH